MTVLHRFIFLFLIFVSLGFSSTTTDPKYSSSEPGVRSKNSLISFPSRDLLLGKVLKSAMENYHFSRLRLDNKISERAHKIFIERLDYSKRYLLQEDVDKLKPYLKKVDDQVENGDLELVEVSSRIRVKRIARPGKKIR